MQRINAKSLKSLVLKRKEGCYCKRDFNRAVNKQILDKNDEKKSKGYGTHADQYRFSSIYPFSLKGSAFPSWIHKYLTVEKGDILASVYTGLFISPSETSELDCATTKTYKAERSISIGRESLKIFLYQGPWRTCRFHHQGVVVTKNGVHSE